MEALPGRQLHFWNRSRHDFKKNQKSLNELHKNIKFTVESNVKKKTDNHKILQVNTEKTPGNSLTARDPIL